MVAYSVPPSHASVICSFLFADAWYLPIGMALRRLRSDLAVFLSGVYSHRGHRAHRGQSLEGVVQACCY